MQDEYELEAGGASYDDQPVTVYTVAYIELFSMCLKKYVTLFILKYNFRSPLIIEYEFEAHQTVFL